MIIDADWNFRWLRRVVCFGIYHLVGKNWRELRDCYNETVIGSQSLNEYIKRDCQNIDSPFAIFVVCHKD